MIEVEKKFLLINDDEQRLLKGATLLGEEHYRDTYYDTPTYDLTTKNWWLRRRDDAWELKIPLPNTTRGEDWVNQYDEVEGENDVRQKLEIGKVETFENDLAARDIKPFCSFRTHRKKYRHAPFTISIDTMDYGYRVAEVEYMVESKDNIDDAAKMITDFAKKKSLTATPVRGKCIEWLRRNNPTHLAALDRAGILHI